MTTTPISLAVLISGGGTTLRNLLEKIESGELAARVALVISSSETAAGLRFAEQRNIPTRVVTRKSCPTLESFRDRVFEPCRQLDIDLVVMGGFLKLVPIPADFAGRVMNIHPSLIPAFSGQGFYGRRVHQAVLESRARVSGCTVHFVDNEYDHGPIILQRRVEVKDDDTPESLAARVFEQECLAYPEAIRRFAAGELSQDRE